MKKFFEEFKEFASSFLSDVVNFIFMAFVLFCLLNITVRQSRQSGVARATCPD